MSFCPRCGMQYNKDAKSCSCCGANLDASNTNSAQRDSDYSQLSDVERNKWLGIISYLSVLVVIPLMIGKDSRFARFHANQGLTLFVLEVIVDILRAVSWFLPGMSSPVFGLIRLGLFILAIIGIVHAAQGEEKELPIIGKISLIK